MAAIFDSFPGVPGRFEPVEAGQEYTVLVDYAHTPDGIVNALRAARELTAGRVITVFGCGGERDRSKRALMGEAAGGYSDLAILTDDNPRGEDPEAIYAEVLPGLERRPPAEGAPGYTRSQRGHCRGSGRRAARRPGPYCRKGT